MTEPLTPAELAAYFTRIGHTGPLAPDLATLTALHAAHVLAIPFENLDVQFRHPPTRDPARIFDKLVFRRRGGWCYEQNGLFARVLVTLGFELIYLSAGVMRQERGDFFMGSHLALKVTGADGTWLADVGFGSSQLEPLAFAPGSWDQAPLAGEIRQTEDGYWRFAITKGPTLLTYDFHDVPADQAQLDTLCVWQGSDPQSIFVQNLVVQQRLPAGHTMLRGKVLTRTTAAGATMRELGSAAELVAVLRGEFGLDVPEAAGLWEQIEERHAALLA